MTYDPAALTSLSEVEFLRLIADDTGFYKCEVEYVYQNGSATYSTTFESQVGELYIVSFQIDLPGSSYNLLGSAVTLSFVTKGPNKPISVSWTYFKGTVIFFYDFYCIVGSSKFARLDPFSYTLDCSKVQDLLKYLICNIILHLQMQRTQMD